MLSNAMSNACRLHPCRCSSLQVRSILEAQQEFKKNDRQLKRAKSSASLPGSEEQAALRAQIEADRWAAQGVPASMRAAAVQPWCPACDFRGSPGRHALQAVHLFCIFHVNRMEVGPFNMDQQPCPIGGQCYYHLCYPFK